MARPKSPLTEKVRKFPAIMLELKCDNWSKHIHNGRKSTEKSLSGLWLLVKIHSNNQPKAEHQKIIFRSQLNLRMAVSVKEGTRSVQIWSRNKIPAVTRALPNCAAILAAHFFLHWRSLRGIETQLPTTHEPHFPTLSY